MAAPVQTSQMAPRKSDASKGVSADDATPQKEKEGVNIEVGTSCSVKSRDITSAADCRIHAGPGTTTDDRAAVS